MPPTGHNPMHRAQWRASPTGATRRETSPECCERRGEISPASAVRVGRAPTPGLASVAKPLRTFDVAPLQDRVAMRRNTSTSLDT